MSDAKMVSGGVCEACGTGLVERPQQGEIRCDCGCLLARVTDAGLELKCRRCKRQVVVVDGATRPS